MIWELYVVYAEATDGYEELIDTTKSLKEAKTLAKQALTEDTVAAIIYREDEEGEQIFVEKLTNVA
jgi:hypothetical protein